MKIEPKIIFGIRTSGAVTLTITAEGQLPQQLPDLWIKTSEKECTVPCSNKTWVTPLGVGDYIVYMPAPGESWFDGRLTFELSAPAMIVSYINTDTAKKLQAWTVAAGTAVTVGMADSKNPWPPPLASNVDPAPLADPVWLGSTLATMAEQVTITRSAPPPCRP
jgi:hypothetical protein